MKKTLQNISKSLKSLNPLKLDKKSQILLIGAGIFLVAVASVVFFKNPDIFRNKKMFSIEDAKVKIEDYLRESMPGATASLLDIIEDGDLYKVTLDVQGQEYISYATKDGKLLFPQAVDLDEFFLSLEMVKKDVPDVKLFIMTYCPYGLQVQKAILPAWQLLQDKADFGIYFVNYIMHDKEEIDENMVQYCIQKEQSDKYLSYASCFIRDGEAEQCLVLANIDKQKLSSCINATDLAYGVTQNYEDEESWLNGYYPKFLVDDDLNKKYGVAGSPTFVINDKVVQASDRSPEGIKELICNAFTEVPAECSQVFSSEPASPGFGLEVGDSSDGSCE